MTPRKMNGKDIKEIFKMLRADFLPEQIKEHPATKKKYVPYEFIEARLDEVVGMENWDFILSEPQVLKLGARDLNSCIITGELILYDDNHVPIKRGAAGGADFIYPEDSDRPTSVANTVDSAGRDAFKRCAKRFGIAKIDNKGKNGRSQKKQMKVSVLEPFYSLTNGGAKTNVKYNNETVELIIWKKEWEELQKLYPDWFIIGKKLESISFEGIEKEYNNKKQLIYVSLTKGAA